MPVFDFLDHLIARTDGQDPESDAFIAGLDAVVIPTAPHCTERTTVTITEMLKQIFINLVSRNHSIMIGLQNNPLKDLTENRITSELLWMFSQACVYSGLIPRAIYLELDGSEIDVWDEHFNRDFCRLTAIGSTRLRNDVDIESHYVFPDLDNNAVDDTVVRWKHEDAILAIAYANLCDATSHVDLEFDENYFGTLPIMLYRAPVKILHLVGCMFSAEEFRSFVTEFADTLKFLQLDHVEIFVDGLENKLDDMIYVIDALQALDLEELCLDNLGLVDRLDQEIKFETRFIFGADGQATAAAGLASIKSALQQSWSNSEDDG